MGGLPGTALTIQDVGVPEIILHGPKGLEEIFKATRRFIILKDLQVKMAPCSEGDIFEDTVMSVRYVPLKKCPPKLDAEVNEMDVEVDGLDIGVQSLNQSSPSVSMKFCLILDFIIF